MHLLPSIDEDNINAHNFDYRSIKKLKKELLNNYDIYNDYYTYFNYNMKDNTENIDNESQKSGKTEITEKYFDNHEQISEVKINMFLILNYNCRFNNKLYNCVSKENMIKVKRLVIQKFTIVNEQAVFCPKEYIFIHYNDIEFNYNKSKFIIDYKRGKIKLKKGEQYLLNEKGFQNNNKFKIEEETNKIIKLESTNSSKLSQSSTGDDCYSYTVKTESNKTSLKDNISKSEQEEDSSDKETSENCFYEKVGNNTFYRYTFKRCDREIDGIYDQHEAIDLKIKGCVNLIDELEKLKNTKPYGVKNGIILFKNFDSKIIEKNEPIIIQVKKGFNIHGILNQIKQNSKIIGKLAKPALPRYIIGYICTYHGNEETRELKELKNPYKNSEETVFSHIKEILNLYKINVVIILYADSKICEYPLNVEDYNIEKEKLIKRVDLEYMNTKIGTKKTQEELVKIINIFENKYKSLTYIKKVPLSQFYNAIDDLEKKDKEIDVLKKSVEQTIEKKDKELDVFKKSVEQTIEKKDKEIDDIKKALEEKDKQIDDIKKALEEKNKEFEEFKKLIYEQLGKEKEKNNEFTKKKDD